MRAEFDASFARPPAPPEADLADVLALRLGSGPAVLRLDAISAVVARPRVTAVPTPVRALLGVSAERGAVIAVYDLGLLLGGTALSPHWMVVLAAEPSVAVAFEQFEGYRRIGPGRTGLGPVLAVDALLETVRGFGQDAVRSSRPALPVPVPQFRSEG